MNILLILLIVDVIISFLTFRMADKCYHDSNKDILDEMWVKIPCVVEFNFIIVTCDYIKYRRER